MAPFCNFFAMLLNSLGKKGRLILAKASKSAPFYCIQFRGWLGWGIHLRLPRLHSS